MEELKAREHDFGSKLRQESVICRLRDYVLWQRGLEKNSTAQKIPNIGPLSINLDLTLACNFACPYCVDSVILKQREINFPGRDQEDPGRASFERPPIGHFGRRG